MTEEKNFDVMDGLISEEPEEPPESLFDLFNDETDGPFTLAGSDKVYHIENDKILDEDGEPIDPEYLKTFKCEFNQLLEDIKNDLETNTKKAGEILARVQAAGPYLADELKKSKYHGETLKSLLYNRTIGDVTDEKDPKSILLLEALEAAEKEQQKIKRPELIATPLDKITTCLYKLSLPENKNKAKLDIETTAHKINAPITHVNAILYFDDDITKKFSLTKELTAFDKLTASAIYSVWSDNHDAAGHCITTLTAIFNAVANGKPNPAQLEKIHNSLIKQSLTRIYIDNREEAETLNYKRFNRGNVALLDMVEIEERTTRNGKLTDGYIKILAEPPAIAFSIAHGREVAQIPAEVFKSNIPKTEKNLAIQDYLIRRIAPARNKLRKLKETQDKAYTKNRQIKINKAREVVVITETLLKNTDRGKNATDKARALATVKKYLDYWKKIKWIEDAAITRDKSKIKIKLSIK